MRPGRRKGNEPRCCVTKMARKKRDPDQVLLVISSKEPGWSTHRQVGVVRDLLLLEQSVLGSEDLGRPDVLKIDQIDTRQQGEHDEFAFGASDSRSGNVPSRRLEVGCRRRPPH